MNPEPELPPDGTGLELPPKPVMPDCCNGGCAVCVLEGYDDEVRRWQDEVDRILAAQKLAALQRL